MDGRALVLWPSTTDVERSANTPARTNRAEHPPHSENKQRPLIIIHHDMDPHLTNSAADTVLGRRPLACHPGMCRSKSRLHEETAFLDACQRGVGGGLPSYTTASAIFSWSFCSPVLIICGERAEKGCGVCAVCCACDEM